MAITLNATTDTIDVVTGAAVAIDYSIDYVDEDGTTFTPGDLDGQITTATTTTIVSAPASSTRRGVKRISITNVGSTTQTVTVRKAATGPVQRRLLPTVSLSAGESLQYQDGRGWYVVAVGGYERTQNAEATGYTGYLASLQKTGTAADATSYWYCTSKDAGIPGAWSVGTSGLAGRATDGTTTADSGCLCFINAASGGMYLTNGTIASTVSHWHMMFDCLWVNNGIVVTTTTAQTINSVAFPARDMTGTVNGVGCWIGLLFTGTATNAAVNSAATVSYTNSNGTAGRTATLVAQNGSRIPATALVGTIVWFMLAAGDVGVQSIQSITLSTSLGAGSVSLLVARPVMAIPGGPVNVGSYGAIQSQVPGVRLYNGSCILHCYRASATTATLTSGCFTIMER